MGVAVENSTIMQREMDTSVTWIHHTNRAERGERGSGAIRGAADTMIEISASGDGVIRVLCSKVKDTEPWAPESYVFKQIGSSGVLVPPSAPTGFALTLTPVEKQIIEFLAYSVFDSRGAQTTEIVNSLNISQRHVYRLMSGLKNKGFIDNVKKRDPMGSY